MRIGFYHLTAMPLERALPRICERVLSEGGRLLIVAASDLAESLDALLWTYDPVSFLPHGREGGDQPVLISEEPEPTNGAANIALADGQWRDEALAFERIFYFFDDNRIGDARTAWRALKGREDADLSYWKQDERGKWIEGP
ncbi:DNA polymerase III subunit chi [Allosphingosinicella flava]|uniref:DNA polymerase III subunit chi n=1 Tax=Allosphingosinicella flava TaxID=2771430 RepID=A0A7T2LMJ7_9SPHN|nr:DNA polymerase III subunit chi [Sphingosinicella flava]QPQ55659.1 DNA polymerase III subunit chi [Sphingosinicella flava]